MRNIARLCSRQVRNSGNLFEMANVLDNSSYGYTVAPQSTSISVRHLKRYKPRLPTLATYKVIKCHLPSLSYLSRSNVFQFA